jgi:hypothetical protein
MLGKALFKIHNNEPDRHRQEMYPRGLKIPGKIHTEYRRV